MGSDIQQIINCNSRISIIGDKPFRMWALPLPFIISFSRRFLYKLGQSASDSLLTLPLLIFLSRILKKIVSFSMSRIVTEDLHTTPNCSYPQPSPEHNLVVGSPGRVREADGKLQPK